MFSQEIADTICDQLAEGKSLRSICRDVGIAESTVRGWEKDNAEFSAHSLRAREIGGHSMADECLDIADAATAQDATVAKLRIDTRLRLLGKWLPKLYGEKVETIHSGVLSVESIKRMVIDPATKTVIEQ